LDICGVIEKKKATRLKVRYAGGVRWFMAVGQAQYTLCMEE
jgi:hypothetical protein